MSLCSYYCEDMLNLRHGVPCFPCSEGFRSKVTLVQKTMTVNINNFGERKKKIMVVFVVYSQNQISSYIYTLYYVSIFTV